MADTVAGLARDHSGTAGDVQRIVLAHRAGLLEELAGAIAHRFNNIMMAISSYAEVELRRATPAQQRKLEQVLGNVSQATSLVRSFLTLSSRRVSSPQPASVNSIITVIVGMLQLLVDEHIEIALNLSPTTEAVNADHVAIEQLILSLTINVRNAMPKGGTLSISTAPVDLDEGFLQSGERVAPGPYVMVSVDGRSRTEAGDVSDRERYAEESESLLLAVQAIVKEAGGIVRCSASGENCKNIEVYLPTHRAEASAERAARRLPRIPAIARTILIVDDDDAVRVPAAEFLKMEGFKVLQARAGVEALRIVERHKGVLDLLVADMIMPSMNGPELARILQATYPDVKVLYMSGDSGSVPPSKGKQVLHMVLRKPFRLNRLKERIHDLLGQ
jgi:two-component system, cell cycle sensor histidine kinase and response regulator CckA